MNQNFFDLENNINNSNLITYSAKNENSTPFFKNFQNFTFGKYDTDSTFKNDKNFIPKTSNFFVKDNNTFKMNNNVNILSTKTFLNKKRKYMSSEELELEQIEKERKEVKEMMRKNMATYYRMNNIQITKIIPKKSNTYNKNNNNNINYSNTNSFLLPINNINKTNGYVNNFLRAKEFHKIINNTTTNNIHNLIKNANISEKIDLPIETQEIINIDTATEKKDEVNTLKEKQSEEKNNNINLKEEKIEEKIVNKNDKNKENIEKNVSTPPSLSTTPNKDNLYLKKMQELGSMSKLSLCNKIKKCTEICKEVIKQQKNKNKNK